MTSTLTGSVTYKNGVAAPGVEVRVFDKDAPGKGDDDLTVQPGLSDRSGKFSVEYDPGRFRDFARLPFFGLRSASGEAGLRIPDLLDILLPYLQFTWKTDGREYTHQAPLELFQDRFKLPQAAEIDFRPSQCGFPFPNAFSGYMLPFSVPFLSDSKVKGIYGLCGGMSAGAADYYLSGRKIPEVAQPPKRGTLLHRYLFRRAIDSFAMGESILRFARWMLLPEDGLNGTSRLTMKEWQKLRAALDEKQLVPIGQLRARADNIHEVTRDVWLNHQVMAYGYSENQDGLVDVHIYDPNCPNADNVIMRLERVPAGEEDGKTVFGLKCYEADCWEKHRRLFGFFVMPYEPVDPPKNL